MKIPSSPADRKKIESALQEISNSLTRVEASYAYDPVSVESEGGHAD